MPSWGEILQEVNESIVDNNSPDIDGIRRKYLLKLNRHTNRNTIIYAANWTQSGATHNPEVLSISDEDLQGFMETVHGLSGNELDLIIHSPGGSPEAAESIVLYLREKFDDIRIIIPQAAMSAATMISCAANKIVMGRQSSLGPIDPQIFIPTKFGVRMVPAQNIVDEFNDASEISEKKPQQLGAWLPILEQYNPGLVKQCKRARELSEILVESWLESYMLKDEKTEEEIAQIAKDLAEHDLFKSHSRHLTRETAREFGLIVEDLEEDQEFQDLVLSVFHATTITFQSGALKIIENHLGKAFVKWPSTPSKQKQKRE